MTTIRFTRPYVVQADGGERYVEGQEIEVSESSAEHFVRRGVAEVVTVTTPEPRRARKG